MNEITLNSRRFGYGAASVARSLFSRGGTLSGHYTRTPNGGIILFDASGNRVGGISRHGTLHSSVKINGKWRHSCAAPNVVGEHDRHAEGVRECRRALEASK